MKEEDRKDEVTKVNEERSSEEEDDEEGGEIYTEKVIRKRMEKKEGERQLGRVNKEDGDGRKTEVMRWIIIVQEREEVMRWRIERNEGW